MAELKSQASLSELQNYVEEHYRERGFDAGDTERGPHETAIHECLLLAEEVGELAKALRKESGMTTDASSQIGQVAHELADVVWVTAAIANIYGIDIEQAFREKEVINHERVWS